MSPDAPDAGGAGAPSEGPPERFDPLVQQAEALRVRGQDRAASLDAEPTPPTAGRRVGVLVAVLVAVIAGAVIGWVASGDDAGERGAKPTFPTTVVPTTTAPSSTTITSSTARGAEPAVPAQPAPTTTPPTTTATTLPRPAVASPGEDGEGGAPAAPPTVQHTVVIGESFWAIAEHEVGQMAGGTPTEAQVASYWRVLIDVNADNLVQAGNPNLIHPGQVLDLPSVMGP